MNGGDFCSNEISAVISDASAGNGRIEFVGDDGTTTVLKDKMAMDAGDIVDATVMSASALRQFIKESIDKAFKIVTDIVSDPEMNKIYVGVVSRIEVYGAFVKFMSDTKEGLVHVSQLHSGRIANVEDMLKLGDKVNVKFIGFDRGKVKLSMKGVEGNPEPKKVSEYVKREDRPQSEGRRDSRPRNDRDRNRNRDNRSRDNRKRY